MSVAAFFPPSTAQRAYFGVRHDVIPTRFQAADHRSATFSLNLRGGGGGGGLNGEQIFFQIMGMGGVLSCWGMKMLLV